MVDGSTSKSDYECDIISGCWYKTPADAIKNISICIPKYKALDGEFFGYKNVTDLSFKYATQENYILGKYC